jgi:hypothetical protein
MTKAQRTYHLVHDFHKLSPEGQQELLAYLHWLRELENQERLQRYTAKADKSSKPLRLAEQS